ncbi:hypothetical protein ACVCIC_00040 [Burkholderia glumae]|uniref:Uncharacterized protein n=1 Tax=Burkholderia glumae TaxID=337 RepID=A0ABY5BC94_BURGL|nr:hypothetical protein [Burkholderia glumae]MCM2547232.1 hypothetical protein [Burkholderia glumae]QGA41784.1 hypothetical protein GAS19_30385 [Burkholderia glumae]USS44158.1 hypothetical protein NFI99_12795 [Burkholderia glumae]
MHQRYLDLPNFRTARDYRYHEHVQRGAELAAAHGLVRDYIDSAWARKTDDWYGIRLVAYIPRDAKAGLFGISRRYDGVYASAECSTPEQASAALAATTLAEFEASARAADQCARRVARAIAADDEADADPWLERDASADHAREPAAPAQLSLF